MRTTLGPIDLGSPVERDHPLNQGRLAWWLGLPGLTGGPVWRDLMGQSPAALAGGYSWGGTMRPGGHSQVSLATTANASANGFSLLVGRTAATWAFWVRLDSASPGRILTQWGSDRTAQSFDIEMISGSLVQFAAHGIGSVYLIANTTTSVPVSAWTHVAVVFVAPSTVNIYFNGILQPLQYSTAGSIASIAPSSSPVELGYETGEAFAGVPASYDDVGIYGAGLAGPQIWSLFDESRRGYPGALWRPSDRLVMALGTGTGNVGTVAGRRSLYLRAGSRGAA